jgi:hypothetical protein
MDQGGDPSSYTGCRKLDIEETRSSNNIIVLWQNERRRAATEFEHVYLSNELNTLHKKQSILHSFIRLCLLHILRVIIYHTIKVEVL